ncbi:hypothetical protein ACFIQF_04875, partial [Comamonas sp. J-3]|uniref:hypothetical protein n=1 Tax=Comamonas trifloxystrobinivorans TaxID=3350256 RepID=UPI00372A4A76
TANSQQPTANSQQPTANSQQPTANSLRELCSLTIGSSGMTGWMKNEADFSRASVREDPRKKPLCMVASAAF